MSARSLALNQKHLVNGFLCCGGDPIWPICKLPPQHTKPFVFALCVSTM